MKLTLPPVYRSGSDEKLQACRITKPGAIIKLLQGRLDADAFFRFRIVMAQRREFPPGISSEPDFVL
jgi:hypothetical protein